MSPSSMLYWTNDWIWGAPLIIVTVVVHVLGLGLIDQRVTRVLSSPMRPRRFFVSFAVVMSITTLLITLLHGFEAITWAVAFRFLGALPDNKSAVLYSLGAMTTYGHANLFLEDRWALLGAIEALNGMLLFGLPRPSSSPSSSMSGCRGTTSCRPGIADRARSAVRRGLGPPPARHQRRQPYRRERPRRCCRRARSS